MNSLELAHELRRIQHESMLDSSPTLEAITVRAEEAAKAAIERVWHVENELRAVDDALDDEGAPHLGADGEVPTRMGRIRHIGDRARRAEAALGEVQGA